MTQELIDVQARIIWDYHLVKQQIKKSDLILVLGSHDERIADRGIELYKQGYGPEILFSGGLGNLTVGVWTTPEADKFAQIALDKGVPKEDILIENKSTNTGENIKFSYELLQSINFNPKSIILVQKPYMERRTYATFMKQWPGEKVDISVTSLQMSYDEYCSGNIDKNYIINIMVGDLQRIKEYPDKGFQIYQDIPNQVWSAYELLVKQGYTKHLIKD